MHSRWLVVALACAASGARAEQGSTDPALDRLLRQAAERNPEVSQARAAVEAERRRVPQAGALPDPVLSLGIQNDGFKSIQIGEMETSFISIGASQTLPWPGKRGLREQVASLELRKAEAALARAGLDLEAQVRGAYVDLLLAREQLILTGELERLWEQARGFARVRYESGQAPQSDLLRAQLELARLGQRRAIQQAQAANAAAALNRLAGNALETPIDSTARLAGVDPALPAEADALQEADEHSPELAAARLAVAESTARTDLARKEMRPDISVQAAVMPRGKLDPMWQVGVSIPLQLWSGRKQGKALEESEHRTAAAGQGTESVRQVLALRIRQRLHLLKATLEVNQRYRKGVLALSEATTHSALAQYQVGRVPFTTVLDALGSLVADRASYLQSSADAQRIAIAQRALTLDPPNAGSPGMTASPTSGASNAAAAPARGATESAQPAASSQGMRSM
ncbi:MAG TPA: TolC family protein [Myxococcales bacterium]|nr:TolC family protein [Myxococcales bacterium]